MKDKLNRYKVNIRKSIIVKASTHEEARRKALNVLNTQYRPPFKFTTYRLKNKEESKAKTK